MNCTSFHPSDLNTDVGSKDGTDGTDDAWDRMRGPYGYGEINNAGNDLLNFLSINEATVATPRSCTNMPTP